MKLILTLVFSFFGIAVAFQWRSTRIVGGEPTDIQTYPYMSNMQYGYLGLWWYQACGGSLITTTSVLSAAHCYEGDTPSSWRVLLGTSLASSGGHTHFVTKLIVHADFNRWTLKDDVAIVKLEHPATLSSSIGLARIAGRNYYLPDGTAVNAIGWGALSAGGASPEQLQHVELDVINQDLCAQRYEILQNQPGYEDWPNITAGMLCLGILDVGGKDACQGDSGGPVAHQSNIIVGITSWGIGCADEYYPGVNTRVSYYSNWIVANA